MTRPPAARTARPGDLCALLAPASDTEWPLALDTLHHAFRGRRTLPLHVTLERFGQDQSLTALAAALEGIRRDLRAATVRTTGELLPFRSELRGEEVLKLAVSPNAGLVRNRELVRHAIKVAGFRSVYGEVHWWTVTVLEGIDPAGLSARPANVATELVLFAARRLLISRINSAGDYSTLYEVELSMSNVGDPEPPARCWIDSRVEVRPSPIEGLGLFAAAPIQTGELVAVLGGRVIDDDELLQISGTPRTYSSAAIDEHTHLLLAHDEQIARGNHSCDPNLWMRDAIRLEARRDIAAGDEITIDYALLTGMPDWEMNCVCGSPLCRKVVRGTDWMRIELQERYRMHFSPFINDRIGRWRA